MNITICSTPKHQRNFELPQSITVWSTWLNVKIFFSTVAEDLKIVPVVLVQLSDLWGGDVPEEVKGGLRVGDCLLCLLLALLHLFWLVLEALFCFRSSWSLVFMKDSYSENRTMKADLMCNIFESSTRWMMFVSSICRNVSNLSSSPHCSMRYWLSSSSVSNLMITS